LVREALPVKVMGPFQVRVLALGVTVTVVFLETVVGALMVWLPAETVMLAVNQQPQIVFGRELVPDPTWCRNFG